MSSDSDNSGSVNQDDSNTDVSDSNSGSDNSSHLTDPDLFQYFQTMPDCRDIYNQIENGNKQFQLNGQYYMTTYDDKYMCGAVVELGQQKQPGLYEQYFNYDELRGLKINIQKPQQKSIYFVDYDQNYIKELVSVEDTKDEYGYEELVDDVLEDINNYIDKQEEKKEEDEFRICQQEDLIGRQEMKLQQLVQEMQGLQMCVQKYSDVINQVQGEYNTMSGEYE